MKTKIKQQIDGTWSVIYWWPGQYHVRSSSGGFLFRFQAEAERARVIAEFKTKEATL